MGVKIRGKVQGVKFSPSAGGATDVNLTISGASYSGTSFDVSSQDTSVTGVSFNSIGTRMFIVGNSSDRVHQYTLSTGFDLSSASYDSISFDLSGQDIGPNAIFFNPGGTKLFMIGGSSDSVHQYSLSTGFDISSASYDSVSFDISSQDTGPTGIYFNSAGTKMFVLGISSNTVYQYTLGTGFDLSTASYDSVSFDISGQDTGPTGIYFNSAGTRMFIVGLIGDSVYQYTLSSGFDLSTASYDSVSLNVFGQDGTPTGIFFNPGGTKMFLVGQSSNSLYEYNL